METGRALPPPLLPPAPPPSRRDAALRAAAAEMEADFLAEMLKSAGAGASREVLGGGIGEDQFTSFLVKEQARQMVRAGGIGLSEQVFNALKARDGDGN